MVVLNRQTRFSRHITPMFYRPIIICRLALSFSLSLCIISLQNYNCARGCKFIQLRNVCIGLFLCINRCTLPVITSPIALHCTGTTNSIYSSVFSNHIARDVSFHRNSCHFDSFDLRIRMWTEKKNLYVAPSFDWLTHR